MIERVISGGQTGVDRAALDAALSCGLPIGGWCPRGRRAEDGCVPDIYPLLETASADYAERTELNIREADGTLILCREPLSGGTALTRKIARRIGKPLLIVDLWQLPLLDPLEEWLSASQIRVLNVAGPRASQQPDIHQRASLYLMDVFQRFAVCQKPMARKRTVRRRASGSTPRDHK